MRVVGDASLNARGWWTSGHLLLALSIAIAVLVPIQSGAASRYVRPGASGSNSGTDWNNAYTTLPTTLVRGDTYYLADGSYGGYTFDDAASGTQTITLKKAVGTDHGTEIGWSAAYGDGQALFGQIRILTDYYVFDGQRRDANWASGAIANYGIRFKGSGGQVVRLDAGGSTGGDNLTFLYVDIEGNGRDSGDGDDAVYGLTGNSNLTFRDCAIHDTDRTLFLTRGNQQNLVVERCYLARNASSPAIHGEMISSYEATGMVFINNVIEDIEGTAVWAGIGNGTWTNTVIMGNTIRHTDSYNREGIAWLVAVLDDESNTHDSHNLRFYNNTMVNISGGSGVNIQAGSGNEVRNNIFYDSYRTRSGGVTHSNNWYYNTIQDGDSSPTKVVCTTNCNKFVSLSGGNYRLTAPIPGVPLSISYGADIDGKARGTDGVWDIGAHEFGGTATGGPPAPPVLLVD